MNINKRLSPIAGALAAVMASGGAWAAQGISIDSNGLLPGGATKQITVFQDAPGNLVTQHVYGLPQGGGNGSTNTEPFVLGQTEFTTNVPGWTVTYQFKIPVTTTLEFIPSGSLGGFSPQAVFTNDGSRMGEFKLFLDMDLTKADSNTGDGYGTLNGGVGSSGQIELAAGEARFAPGPTGKMTIGPASTPAGEPPITFLADNRDGSSGDVDTVMTERMSGSASVEFLVGTQNTDYVLNDLVGTLMDVDFNLLSLGPLAPFDAGADASHRVVGVDTTAAGFYGNDSSGVKLNDFACGDDGGGEDLGGGDIAEACSAQYQTSVSFIVNAETVPEPASVALLGIGMTFVGMAAVRRRRRAAV